MNNENNPLTCAGARDLDIVDYLARIGYKPIKNKKDDYWYLSPLRNEKTASFKVNRQLNRWYDHGIGKGGNIIDFGILFYSCTIREFLQKLNGSDLASNILIERSNTKTNNSIEILQDLPLGSTSLIQYCKQRGIKPEIATKCCSEVHFKLNEKKFYAIGFKNDAGGYELRNSFFKCSSSPKGITTIKNGASAIAVFEGFFDFLSFKFLFQKQHQSEWDFCVLNSLSFFDTARPFLEVHSSIHLYLDNDHAGQILTRKALASNAKYKDESNLYKNFKDINDWIVGMGKTSRNANNWQAKAD